MSDVKPSFYKPVESHLVDFFYAQFFAPILNITDTPVSILNSASALIAAIRSGKIQYINGEFRGEFNITLSRELSAFAKYDRRSRTWRGNPPPEVKSASVVANGKRDQIAYQLKTAISKMESQIETAIQGLSLGPDIPLFEIEDNIKTELESVGVYSPLTDGDKKAIRDKYTYSQQLNVKNWAPEQIVRLRELVERYQTTGDNGSLRAMIEKEWNVSTNKARFLARQETSLLFSKLQLERAGRAGVRRYRWSTSHDERVRESHKELNGKIISLDSPPIVDKRTGRRAHAGEDFNCRCAKIWLLDKL